jgi:hypothetical protein
MLGLVWLLGVEKPGKQIPITNFPDHSGYPSIHGENAHIPRCHLVARGGEEVATQKLKYVLMEY